ncbi:MAG: 23S rRNA (adenine(2503)-C(2))-methyltransferase RlmN [Myxococcales bacterium]|nr:23S rRNA (adenine(2503)-C(2))-methyltransferase RlmN [Myxococcales bacterium]
MSAAATESTPAQVDLRALTLDETAALVSGRLGWPAFRAGQIWQWVHGRGVTSIEQMTNLSKVARDQLAAVATLGTLRVDIVQTSRDGTRKLRLVTSDGQFIESVLIPDGDKTTQCISSQVGCAMDCQFCATAKMGLIRNLSAGEIVDQVYRARALLAEVEPGRRISNIVYMGMGEPLHNYDQVLKSLEILHHDLGAGLSYRRMTVSTSGLVPRIEKLGQEGAIRPNLAISLNASDNDTRDEVMPVNKKYKIEALLAALRAYPLEHRRRITFEYVLLGGVNDTLADAARLAQLLRGMPCKVNLIPWNPHPGARYEKPTAAAVAAFQAECKRRGLPTYLRATRGDDIDAACGQLANRQADGSTLVPLRVARRIAAQA